MTEAKEGNQVALLIETLSPSNGSTVEASLKDSRKKRGRPRKISSEGSCLKPEVPATADVSSEQANSVFGSFMPQMIGVADGEDVGRAILSFTEQSSRVISVLSARGRISLFTVFQPGPHGGTLTYEGHFEIISMTGTHIPVYRDGIKAIHGGITVTVAGKDGRILGGSVGRLVAAGPVEVQVASSPVGHSMKRPKKQRVRTTTRCPADGEGTFGAGEGTTRADGGGTTTGTNSEVVAGAADGEPQVDATAPSSSLGQSSLPQT